jgi:major membrane immunogen (membrane-anchored lipoprotein)
MKRSLFAAAVLLAACGSEDPPSCQQAVATYYGADCRATDADGELSEAELRGACQQAVATAPSSCLDELDDFLFCLDSAESGNDASCDCSREYDSLLRC